MGKTKSKRNRNRRRHTQNGSSNGSTRFFRKRGGSLRNHLRGQSWTTNTPHCPVCGCFLGSAEAYHRHLFGDDKLPPRCNAVRKWLTKRRRGHRFNTFRPYQDRAAG